jgi:hypothetical protein
MQLEVYNRRRLTNGTYLSHMLPRLCDMRTVDKFKLDGQAESAKAASWRRTPSRHRSKRSTRACAPRRSIDCRRSGRRPRYLNGDPATPHPRPMLLPPPTPPATAWTSTIGVSPVTVTVSATPATSSANVIVVTLPAATVTGFVAERNRVAMPSLNTVPAGG